MLLQFPPAFASTSLHRLLSLQKKKNTWFCLRCAGLFCLSNYYLGCRCLALVAEGFLHGLCFFFSGCLTSVFASFCIHKPSSATKLAKKKLVLSPLRGAFVTFNLLFRMLLPGARSPGFSSQPLFFLWCLTPVFSSFWIRKPSSATRIAKKHKNNIREEPTKQQRALSNVLAQDFLQRLVFFWGLCFWIRKPSWATRTAKNKQTPEENTKNKPNDSQNVWAQDFLQRLRFLCLFYVFVIFGSGSFHQLLGLKKNKSTSGNNKNFKKTKTPKDFQECLGPGFSFFRAFDFFWCFSFSCYSTFFCFWIRKLSTATRIAKNKKHLRKTKKNQRIQRNVWPQDFLQRLCFF